MQTNARLGVHMFLLHIDVLFLFFVSPLQLTPNYFYTTRKLVHLPTFWH